MKNSVERVNKESRKLVHSNTLSVNIYKIGTRRIYATRGYTASVIALVACASAECKAMRSIHKNSDKVLLDFPVTKLSVIAV